MSNRTESTRERSLTPPEVQDRTAVLLHLLDEQDTIRFRVRASRDELREWRVEARKLATQIDEVRQEIRTGIVVESAQPELPYPQAPKPVEPPAYECCECLGTMQQCELNGSLQWVCPKCDHPDIVQQAGLQPPGIDGASEEPDSETDPPAPDPYFTFNQNYPRAETSAHLFDELHKALTETEYAKLDGDLVRSWKPATGIFDAVSHWARVENAHQSHKSRAPTPGIVLPARFPMPGPLQQALASSQPKKPAKTGKKTRARKATP